MKHSVSPSVSAIIPNYNGLSLLKKNLPKVLDSLRHEDELIIGDDASSDGSVRWLTQQFHLIKMSPKETVQQTSQISTFLGMYKDGSKRISVRVFINKENSRFGETVNRGIKLATNQLIFLLNNDVSPNSDALDSLLPHFKDSSVFAVAPLEIEQGTKSGKNLLWFEKGLFFHSKSPDFRAGETSWVSGGSGVFDKNKWLQIHGFDKRFSPAYWEDIDLSFRARQQGWKVLFEPNSQVAHNHESTNHSTFGRRNINLMSWRNADRFTWKNGNLFQKLLHLLWKPYWWYQRSKSLN